MIFVAAIVFSLLKRSVAFYFWLSATLNSLLVAFGVVVIVLSRFADPVPPSALILTFAVISICLLNLAALVANRGKS